MSSSFSSSSCPLEKTYSPDAVAATTSAAGGELSQAPTDTTSVNKIANMNELKEKAKPIYNAILMAIAMRMKHDQEAANQRIKQILHSSR